MEQRILVLTPSFAQHSSAPMAVFEGAGCEVVRRVDQHPANSTQVCLNLEGMDAILVGLDEIDEAVVEEAKQRGVKVIAKHGVGVDNIDVSACHRAGITVLNAPGSNSNAVAELVFALILALSRQIVSANQSTSDGQWLRYFGPELYGKTLGIVGFGRIGQEVSRIAQGFRMNVVSYDPFLPSDAFTARGAAKAELDEVLRTADFITLHAPLNDGKPIIDAEEINVLKQGSYIINAARGGLVNEAAIAAALHNGKLAGYAADAHSQEPIVDNPFVEGANVILTPHIGAFTDRANEVMGVMIAEDIVRVLNGQEGKNKV